MQEKKRKYVVVVGSLMSGLGKGIATASIGKILQAKGLKVVPVKFDGYLNVDCGTMNPYRHGEVFVLDDGTECDMDLGNYERFLNIDLVNSNNLTGGKIFRLVIDKERKGGYLGYDVQFVPHLTNEIKKWIKKVGEDFNAEIVLVEVGGTVGDLENGYFLEAMRQLEVEGEDVVFAQVTYVPSLAVLGEQKTKPTQQATRLLLSLGIQPDVIVCRGEERIGAEARKKISLYCNVQPEAIIDDQDVKTIYEVPQSFEKQNLSHIILSKLGIENGKADLEHWSKLVEKIKNPSNEICIGITGKYTAVKDAYVSVKEALVHAGAYNDVGIKVKWIETTDIEEGKQSLDVLKDCRGIIVPGGFGDRGVEGKIKCIQWARKNKVPFLGLCLGVQLQVVEWARNICGWKDAHSTEISEKTKYPVVDILPEQRAIITKGATMRLGDWQCKLAKGTKAHEAYGTDLIHERHRHRYEVNPEFVEKLKESGLVISGTTTDGKIVEIVEWKDSFGIGTQAHPELKSRLERPAPLFMAFVKAAKGQA